ncbi:rhodanese-like domain-containing protein [Paraburkholderia sp. EG285A]|uniref:rhodanese-like domain-containing protein n=1 Tax=Paraburkholderia sp. EG285A TaxID=3237009 RepID=UPI0034D2CE56
MSYQELDAIALGELLREHGEIAVIDLRPSAAFGNGTPLHGTNVPLLELERRIDQLVPHQHTPVALVDGDGSLIGHAAEILTARGYADVVGLRSGMDFNDRLPVVPIRVAAPRIISGEVERSFRVPVTTPHQLAALRAQAASVTVLDTRSVGEYLSGHIPGSYPAPGGEILPLFHALIDVPDTHVVLTCAGRSRAVLAAQTLIDAGVPNPVSTLDFGTLGWRDAGFELGRGPEETLRRPDAADLEFARVALAPLGARFPVHTAHDLERWQADVSRTTYALDVRLPEAFERSHLPGSVNAPAGQLGIWIGKWVAVQGARLALIDDPLRIRALTVARWFERLGWDIAIVEHDFGA